ncbi:estradiol 17 beta-dehydrogenase 5-like [Lissotriton helveticus]
MSGQHHSAEPQPPAVNSVTEQQDHMPLSTMGDTPLHSRRSATNDTGISTAEQHTPRYVTRSPTSRDKEDSSMAQDPKWMACEATKVAISAGIRHIDCAQVYGNEDVIGQAIREKISDGTVKREDIFYTGKLYSTFHSPKLVRVALEKSLKDLQLDYMDLYLIHLPIALKPGDVIIPQDENGKILYDNTDLRDTWQAMEECKDAGLVKSLGVSNFNRKQLERILSKPGLKYKPICNQVECHPFLNQSKLLEFCKSKDIVLEGHSVLGSARDATWHDLSVPVLLENEVLKSIATKHQKTPANVSIRYLMQRGVVPIFKSFNPDHSSKNLEVFDFSLTPEDMNALDELNRNHRYFTLKHYSC